MGNISHRNPIQIATTTNEYLSTALSTLKDREFLYNRDTNTLGIVFNHEFKRVSLTETDEYNVTINEEGKIALKNDIVVGSVTTQADKNGVDWKSQSLLAQTTESHKVILLCKQDMNKTYGVAIIGGEILETGDNVYGHYEISLTSTGSRFLKGSTTSSKKAKLCIAKYNDDYYYGIKLKTSSETSNVYFAGWKNTPDALAAPTFDSYTDDSLSEIIELDDDSDTGTNVIDYKIVTYTDSTWEFTGDQGSYSNGSQNPDWDWGNGLMNYDGGIKSYWYPNNSMFNNQGFVQFQNSGVHMSLIILGACTVTVGICSSAQQASNIRTLNILDEDLSAVLATGTTQMNAIKEVTCNYSGTDKKTIYFSGQGGAIRYMYIKLQYKASSSAGDAVVNIIENLDTTGEDGSPHILRLSGTLKKSDLLAISKALLESEKQIVLDLSKCTACSDGSSEDCTDWSNEDLTSLFQGCSSLRKFYYPQGVIHSGGKVFINCSFLRELYFNDDIKTIGLSGWISINQGFFSGARIKKLWMPKQLQNTWQGYFFANNNIKEFWFYPDSWYADNQSEYSFYWSPNSHWQWNTFSLARADFVFKLPANYDSSNKPITTDDSLYAKTYRYLQSHTVTFSGTINSMLSSSVSNVESLESSDTLNDRIEPYNIAEYFTVDNSEYTLNKSIYEA